MGLTFTKIEEVLSNTEIECLLDQHDRYTFRDGWLAVSRRDKQAGWYGYVSGMEVHTYEDPSLEPQPFDTLVDAVEYMTCPLNREQWEDIRSKKENRKP